MDNGFMNSGVYHGRVLIQDKKTIGGNRYVFVKIGGGAKNDLVFPTTGCRLMNPFKGYAKFYAGDLVEYRLNGIGYILKTFKVAAAVTAADTAVLVERDGYKHIPFATDVLMKAPAQLTGTGTAADVVSVEKYTDNGKDVWKITLSAAIGALAVGDILVEAEEKGAGKKMLVQNPNMVLPWDLDCVFDPATVGDADDFEKARYTFDPVLSELAYEHRMSPLPDSVKKLNTSRVVGWFKI